MGTYYIFIILLSNVSSRKRENLTGGPSAGSPGREGRCCRGLSGLKHNRRHCRTIRRRTIRRKY